MPKRHADSTQEKKKAAKRRKLSADEVLVEAAKNGDTTAVRAGLEKWTPDTDSKKVAFDAVHEACRGNHDECLALLLPYVETTQMGFGMLLSECVHADHTACTEVLLQHWKSVCSNIAFVPHGLEEGSEGEAPRACPAMWGNPAVCQVLIAAGANIEIKNGNGRSPLHAASRFGKLGTVKMLVRAGAGVRVADNDGDTCLTLAAYFGHTETVRYLVGLPDVEVNHEESESFTALHFAVQEGHRDVVEVLIDAGADIDARTSEGCTPLHYACGGGKLAIVKVLVKAGADVCATYNEGATTCVMSAVHDRHTETVRYLVGLPEVDVNAANNRSCILLHAAVTRCNESHPDIVEVLIDAGADIEAKNGCGRSPLLLACEVGKLNAVKLLVEAGARVCATDDQGATCLILAAYFGHTETVRYLVGLPDVDVNLTANEGETALHYASRKKHTDVVRVLVEHGAVCSTDCAGHS